MKINSFDDIDKWIFRALLYYLKYGPSSDHISSFEYRKVLGYFSRLVSNRKAGN